MHLTDAMIDVKTGNPIAPGEIRLKLGRRPPVTVPPHTHLLLDFSRYDPASLTCRAISQMTKLENGFYAIETLEPHIEIRPMSRAALGALVGSESEMRVSFGAASCGACSDGFNKLYEVVGFELVRRLQAKGMDFLLGGAFGAPQTIGPRTPGVSGAIFDIEGHIPWETLKLCGLAVGGLRHRFVGRMSKFTWQRLASLRDLDPCALRDIRIGFDLSSSLAAGFLELSGRPRGTMRAADRIVETRCDSGGLSLYDSDGAELGEDGFCLPGSHEASFSTRMITLPMIEECLHKRERTAWSVSGDDVGGVTYKTGYADEQGDPLGHISQAARRVDLEAGISKNGLRLRVSAALHDFEPEVIEQHRKLRGSQLAPWSQVSAEATLPWSILLIMGSRLADRREAFHGIPVPQPG